MGHSVDGTTASYFKADPEAVKQEYITILDHITTNKVEIKIVNQYEDLKQDVAEIKNESAFSIDLVSKLLNMTNIEVFKQEYPDLSPEELEIKYNEERAELIKQTQKLKEKKWIRWRIISR
nr:hypothetical protein [Methanobacterium formicicum]